MRSFSFGGGKKFKIKKSKEPVGSDHSSPQKLKRTQDWNENSMQQRATIAKLERQILDTNV